MAARVNAGYLQWTPTPNILPTDSMMIILLEICYHKTTAVIWRVFLQTGISPKLIVMHIFPNFRLGWLLILGFSYLLFQFCSDYWIVYTIYIDKLNFYFFQFFKNSLKSEKCQDLFWCVICGTFNLLSQNLLVNKHKLVI